MSGKIYIIGAGISGLTAAYYAGKKNNIEIFEASPQAGGRCRSYFDDKLGCVVDNGNHLVLSANRNFIRLCKDIEAYDNFYKYKTLPQFYDAEKNLFLSNWEVKKLFVNYLVSGFFKFTPIKNYKKKFYKLINESIFNTNINEIDKGILKTITRKIFFNSLTGIRYLQPKNNWQEAFIEPILQGIKQNGGEINYNHSLSKIEFENGKAVNLIFSNGKIIDCSNDKVILATTNSSANKLLDDDCPPLLHTPILNVHFKVKNDVGFKITGVFSELVDWIFCKGDVVSITKSALDKSADNKTLNNEEFILQKVSSLCRGILGNNFEIVSSRILIEKRATLNLFRNPFSSSRASLSERSDLRRLKLWDCFARFNSLAMTNKENLTKRPGNKTKYKNLFLCGDYTDTGLPATIEGAVISGKNCVI